TEAIITIRMMEFLLFARISSHIVCYSRAAIWYHIEYMTQNIYIYTFPDTACVPSTLPGRRILHEPG
ncbi:MAG: hypothetical protein ACYS3S_19320, partial [Planctomycetota bacterium]